MRGALLVVALLVNTTMAAAQSDPDYPSLLMPPPEWQTPSPPPPGVPTHVWELPLYPSPPTAPWKREKPDVERRKQCYALLTARQQWMARYKYFLYQNTQERGGQLWHQETERIDRVVQKRYYYMEKEFRSHSMLGNLDDCRRLDREIKEFVNSVLWDTMHQRLD